MHLRIIDLMKLFDHLLLIPGIRLLRHKDLEHLLMCCKRRIRSNHPCGFYPRLDVAHNNRIHYLLLGLEVVIKCPLRNVHDLQNIIYSRFGVALRAKQHFSGVQYFIFPFVRMFRYSHYGTSTLIDRPSVD
ncbi:hypothetical protein D3C78_1451290 [compost metagenome]